MENNSIQIGKLRMELFECSNFGPKFEDRIKQGFMWTVEITLMRGSKRYRFFYDEKSGQDFINGKLNDVKSMMKGNDGTGNVIERDDWHTPQWLFDMINSQYHFVFDCCATKENTKCDMFHNDFLNKLIIRNATCWMNPPFSKAEEMFEHFFDVVDRGVCIYRCDNLETGLWQNIILKNATWIFIPKGRISYEGKEGKGSRFPSALIGFNVPIPNGLDGHTLIVQDANKGGKDEC